MSRSHHVTYSQIKGLTKSEINETEKDANSLLSQWAQKNLTKQQVKNNRKKIRIFTKFNQ